LNPGNGHIHILGFEVNLGM